MADIDFTGSLAEWRQGDRQALDRLFDAVYAELRRLASRQMASESSRTLSATALVNEAYLRFANSSDIVCNDRAHFFAIASRLMRRILVDAARARGRKKRGEANCNAEFRYFSDNTECRPVVDARVLSLSLQIVRIQPSYGRHPRQPRILA